MSDTATMEKPKPTPAAKVATMTRYVTSMGGDWPARIANHLGFTIAEDVTFEAAMTAWADQSNTAMTEDEKQSAIAGAASAMVEKNPKALKLLKPASVTATDEEVERAIDALLTIHLPKRGMEGQRRAMNHLRAVTGRSLAIANYSNSGDYTNDQKIEVFRDLAKALASGDYSKLKGQIANGDKRIDPIAMAAEAKAKPIADIPAFNPEADTEIVHRMTKFERPAVESDIDDVEHELARVLAKLKGRSGTAKLDESRVKELTSELITKALADHAPQFDEVKAAEVALEVVKKAMSNGEFPMERVEAAINEAMKNVGATRIDIVSPEGGIRSIEGIHHWQLPQVVAWVQANVPLWLWGKAGAGKTHLADTVAACLNTTATIISIDPTITVGKLLGYRNLANGEYVPGFLLAPYRDGGVVLLDEIDTGDPGIIACLNALIANASYTFPTGDRVKRHPQFRVIAGANTRGSGAVAGYTARNRLDAATLDRFAIVELTYDRALEWALATGTTSYAGERKTWAAHAYPDKQKAVEAWVKWKFKVEDAVGSSVLVSPRAAILGGRGIMAGIPPAEVAEACIYKLVSADTRKNIVSACGEFNPEAA